MKLDDTIQIKYLEVTARNNESPDRMIKRFMKKVREDGVLKEFSSRTYHERPSIVKRRKRAQTKWNAQSLDKN